MFSDIFVQNKQKYSNNKVINYQFNALNCFQISIEIDGHKLGKILATSFHFSVI